MLKLNQYTKYFAALLLVAALLVPANALARRTGTTQLDNAGANGTGRTAPAGGSSSGSGGDSAANTNDTGIDCNKATCGDPAADPKAACSLDKCDFIKKYVNPTINLLTVLVGLIAAGSIIAAGIQYSTSEGDPQKSAKAKERLQNTIIALVFYFFLYAFLQFLIPGGIFS